MEYLTKLFKNIGSFVGRMSPSQVMMLFGVIAGTIIGGVYVVGWVGNTTYATLYSGLEEAEAGEVVTYLSENKIPYQITGNGNTIEVPSGDVYQARLSLASQGLPRGGNIGYSIFDQNNLGMTDFLQNLNFRRALEGELTRTIMQLREVQAARVHIVMPKERLFKEDQKEATASVVLKLGGMGLSKSQIAGISHLVASSVEGLKPANITIIDYNGNMLSSGQETDALAGLSSSQLEANKQVEEYLTDKAQSMLDGVLGANRSIVRVTADLNFQQSEKTSELYDADQPSIRSEERTKASASATDKPAEDSESNQQDQNETTITNYELNKTVEHIIGAVGSIQRLSVAVLIDGTYEAVEGGDGGAQSVYQPRSQDELDRLAAIVRNAVGYDQQRSDQIEIVNIPFDRQDITLDREALDSMYLRDFYLDTARKLAPFLIGAFLFFYLRKKSKRLFKTMGKLLPSRAATTAARPEPIMTEPEEQVEELPEPVLIQPEKRRPRLVEQMQEQAGKNPEEIARVIKTIMAEAN